MDTWIWILVGLLVALVLLLVVARRAARSGVDPTQVSIEPDVMAKLEELCGAGRKVEAIRVLRQSTGLGLAPAVAIVERIDRKQRGST